MKRLFIAFLLMPFLVAAQPYAQPSASEIQLKIKKLNFLGSVLYVAAHPDDENTRMITVLANEKLATTGYLSMTRGDGGQNLIGPEIRDLLGLIRTQELLAARRIDGGRQYFTRAVDFGYSKSPEETFDVWNKDEILSDVVRIFRQYQPDVVITRFPPNQYAGHGHHTASAILAGDAFTAAADPKAYPEQVESFGSWQAMRLYTNTGRWWNQSINEDTPGVVVMDVGHYSPLLGSSYTEIAARSSSQHKSQGWGRRGTRGEEIEFLEHRTGEPADEDIFAGVNTTWSRLKGGQRVQPLVDALIRDFDPLNPSGSVPALFRIRDEIEKLDDGVWKRRKLAETEQLIQDCLGLFLEATAGHYYGVPGHPMAFSIEMVNRSALPVKVEKIGATTVKWDTVYNAGLPTNEAVRVETRAPLSSNATYSEPYWLREPHGTGRFELKDDQYIGLPQNPPAAEFTFALDVDGKKLSITRPLVYKWVDRVKGELWRPFEVVPAVVVNPSDHVLIFSESGPKLVSVTVRANIDGPVAGTLTLSLPRGWRTEPASVPFKLDGRDAEQVSTFRVFPPESESSIRITAMAEVDGKAFDESLRVIAYDHFPVQTLLPPAEIKAVRINLEKAGNRIAYIRGAGDDIPSALRNMGYDVWEMNDSEVTPENLKTVDAVVFGIRAFNTNTHVGSFMDDVLAFAKNGGTVVVQYNTVFDIDGAGFAPAHLKISRDRVTEEDAEVTVLNEAHPVLNVPNKITGEDFEGWVQERGLYFPDEWDPAFDAILSMHDGEESAKSGSLLIAKYGDGHYVYTGISFFRQLPEGVPGAYRLFANIVSLGNASKPSGAKRPDKTK